MFVNVIDLADPTSINQRLFEFKAVDKTFGYNQLFIISIINVQYLTSNRLLHTYCTNNITWCLDSAHEVMTRNHKTLYMC